MVDVNEIRARWEAVQTPVVQGLKMPPTAQYEAFLDNADDDIAFLLAEIGRLQREAAAGYKLYAALKRHHENDMFEMQFAESVERVLCAYEQRTGRAVSDEH